MLMAADTKSAYIELQTSAESNSPEQAGDLEINLSKCSGMSESSESSVCSEEVVKCSEKSSKDVRMLRSCQNALRSRQMGTKNDNLKGDLKTKKNPSVVAKMCASISTN